MKYQWLPYHLPFTLAIRVRDNISLSHMGKFHLNGNGALFFLDLPKWTNSEKNIEMGIFF